jgi:acarbose 7IV-phosphotransferase
LIDGGKTLAVCTMAAAGAIALDADRQSYATPAIPDVEIVDSDGAGDAFFAGTLFGVLSGAPPAVTLRYGAVAGGLAVTSPNLASAELSPERLSGDPGAI